MIFILARVSFDLDLQQRACRAAGARLAAIFRVGMKGALPIRHAMRAKQRFDPGARDEMTFVTSGPMSETTRSTI